MKFVLHSHDNIERLTLRPRAQDKIRISHWPQTTRDCDFQRGTSLFIVYIMMIPEWYLVPEREFHSE